MPIGSTKYRDQNGLWYRKVYELDHEGCIVEKGRLYETLPDSRQQPKSLAYKLREEENNKNNATRISPYRCRNCS